MGPDIIENNTFPFRNSFEITFFLTNTVLALNNEIKWKDGRDFMEDGEGADECQNREQKLFSGGKLHGNIES